MRRAEGFEVQAANMFVSHSVIGCKNVCRSLQNALRSASADVTEGGFPFDRAASRLSALTGGKRAWNGCLSASMFDCH